MCCWQISVCQEGTSVRRHDLTGMHSTIRSLAYAEKPLSHFHYSCMSQMEEQLLRWLSWNLKDEAFWALICVCTCKSIYLICGYSSLAPNCPNVVPNLYFEEVKNQLISSDKNASYQRKKHLNLFQLVLLLLVLDCWKLKMWQSAALQSNNRGQ